MVPSQAAGLIPCLARNRPCGLIPATESQDFLCR